jgi:hypothetical protein
VSTLEQRITETLALHQWYDATTDHEDPATGCTGCDDWFSDENAIENGAFATHQAAVLAPVIAEAQAEALRAAAVGFVVVDIKTRELDWDGVLHPTREAAVESLTGPHQMWCRTREEATDERSFFGEVYEILPVTR